MLSLWQRKGGNRWARRFTSFSADQYRKPKNLETPILSPNKLEDILPHVVNRLSPSNIKRTANNLLDEWEKSLVAPTPSNEEANKENATA
jgi:hypothetical protein